MHAPASVSSGLGRPASLSPFWRWCFFLLALGAAFVARAGATGLTGTVLFSYYDAFGFDTMDGNPGWIQYATATIGPGVENSDSTYITWDISASAIKFTNNLGASQGTVRLTFPNVTSITSITPTASVGLTGHDATIISSNVIEFSGGTNSSQNGAYRTWSVVADQTASTDAYLSALTASGATLSPTFTSGTLSYTATVPYATTSVTLTPTLEDSTATLKINGTAATSGAAKTVSLSVGANFIGIVVTAADGTTTKSYSVGITRSAASSNADLSNLTLSSGTLSPSFASGTTSYTATVGNAVTSVNVTPTVADSTATLKVNGNSATSGSASAVSLNVGSNTITVLVTAQDGTTQKAYTTTVTRVAPSISVSPSFPPNMTAGSAYSQTFTASGGTAPYTFAITAGSLPAGMTLSSAGVLSGTPTEGGPFNFTVTATDASSYTGSNAYTLAAQAAAITLTTTSLADGAIGSSYSQSLAASGGTAPYTYSKTGGTLPAGLSLSTSGNLTGVPTQAGSFTVFLAARDSSTGTGPFSGGKSFSFSISAPTVSLSPSTLSAATVGSTYSATLSGSGGTSPYAFAVTAGALPAGLSLSASGELSGTPTAGGTFNFTVAATDSSTGTGAPFTASRSYSLTANAPTISLSPSSLPGASGNVPYSQTITASGGTATYTYTLTAGALPPGLTLSSAGVISGRPTTLGTFNCTITATDSSTGTGPYTASRAYSIAVTNVAPVAGFGTAYLVEASRSEGTLVADNAAYAFGTGSFTVEAWVKRAPNSASFYTIVGKQDGGGGNGFYLRFNGDSLSVAAGSSTTANFVNSSHTIADGEWHHVAAVRDATAKTLSIYVDGALDCSSTYTTAYDATSTASLGIGYKPGYGEYLDGSLDDVRLWNVARTPAQIADTLRAPLAGTETGLVGYWNFEEASGATVTDRSATANPGTMQNLGGTPARFTGDIDYAATTAEDTSVTLRLGGSDTDDQATATAIVTALPTHGTLYQTDDGLTAGAALTTGSTLTDAGLNPRRVIYTPAANYNGTDSFTYKVNDGFVDSANTVTVNVTIAAVNDLPVLTSGGTTPTFIEGNNVASTPVAVDNGIIVSDVDSPTLASATVAITGNFVAAEDVLAFSNTDATTYGNITASYNTTTGVLTLTSAGSTATLAQWQAALRTVTYTNTSDTPSSASRTMTFTANDGAGNGTSSTGTVAITPTNDSAVITTSSGSASFSGSNTGTPTPVAIDSGITLTDADSTTLASVTMIGASPGDVLAFTNTDSATYGNIGGTYNVPARILQLSSSGATATLAQWQAAIRAVTFTSTRAPLNTTPRTITFVANDGGSNSTPVTRQITVSAVEPGAPTIGSATAGDAQASVTFTAPTYSGGATITSYTVTSNPGGATGTGTGSPIVVTGLTNGTAYTFTVTATNSVGTGSASSASNSVTPKGDQTITFANPGAQNFGTTPALTATASSDLAVTFTSSTPNVATVTADGHLAFLTTGTATIDANQAGNSSWNAAPTVTRSFTVNAVTPGAPTGVSASPANAQASVSFTAPGFTGGAAITSYTVTSAPGGITASGSGSPITVTGLSNGTAYTFSVTATNSAGTGSASSASAAVTPLAAPVITSALTASGAYGSALTTYAITATNSPTSYGATGLPAGLSINTSTGQITGTPTAAGNYDVTISATNVGGTGNATLSLSVNRVALTVTGVTVADKTLDGNTTATIDVSHAALVGVLSADLANVTLDTSAATAAFADGAPGALKLVTISGLALTGSASSNYSLTPPTATASILLAFPIAEDFDGKTTADVTNAGWLVTGNATVTGDRLQLTAAQNAQAGAAIYNLPFSSATGVNVQFNYYMGGGTHADGLSVFLLDGAQTAPTAGGNGGALGYAYSGETPGASKAYLGVGFDRFGNFANSTYFSPASGGVAAALAPNAISLRGPASANNSGYSQGEYKFVGNSLVDYAVEGTQKVNLTISPTGHVTLRVSSNAGGSWNTIYNDVDVTGTAAFAGYTLPATLKLGFAASTGGQNNQHTIDNVLVRKPADLAVAFTSTPSGTQSVGAEVTYTVDVTNNGFNADPAAAFYYALPSGLTNVTWSYAITGGASGSGTGSTIASTLNLPVGATATFTVTGTLASTAAGVTLVHTATVTPSDAFGDTNAADNAATAITTVYPAPTITSATTAAGTYGAAFTYTITGTALPTSFAATGLPGGLTLDTATGVISGTPTQAGSFTVALGATNTAGTGHASLDLTVAPVALTVTAAAQTKTYGNADPALTYAITAGALVGTDAFTGALARAVGENVGTYTIGQGTLSAGANYALTFVAANLTVTRRTVTPVVTVANKSYDGTTAATIATRTLTGTVANDAVTLTGGTATFGSATAGTGSVAISGLSLAGTAASNYVLASTTTTATASIAKLDQTISFAAIGDVLIGQRVGLSASASTSMPVSFAIVSGPAKIVGDALVVNAAGTVTVRATQAGDANYNGATADQMILVAKKSQTISFAAIGDHRASDAAFDLSATASSGLPVSFTIVDGPALITTARITLSGAPGTVTVRASQAGDDAYNAAADVDRTFTVAAVGPLVYFGSIGANTFAVTTTPDGASGTLIGILPGTNEAFVANFIPDAGGSWTATTTTYPATGSLTASGSGSLSGVHAFAATAAVSSTRTFRGQVTVGAVTGSVDGLGLSFSAPLQPPVGPTSGIAGYYQSSSLQTATGSIYTMVGTQGTVYALVISPSYVGGNTGTSTPTGTFQIAGAADVTVTGAVDPTTTQVTGTLTRPQMPAENFAGLSTSTVRTDRMLNLSSRGTIANGSELITGFVVGGPVAKTVLLRAVGPTLATYGVGSPLPAARLRLYDARGNVLRDVAGSSADASLAATFSRLGAFPLNAGDGDAAVVVTLEPGLYSMQVLAAPDAHGNVSGSGIGLAEIYDASANPSSEYQRLINISSRGRIQSGDGVLIGGFVVNGNAPKRVLIRGAGPSLAKYGVSSPLADPTLTVYAGTTVIARNDNWETPVQVNAQQVAATAGMIVAAGQQLGAFPYAAGSRDAAVIVTLAPGAYSAVVGSADGGTGTGLIEVYEVAP